VQRVLANGSCDRSNLFARSLPAARLLNRILGGLGGPARGVGPPSSSRKGSSLPMLAYADSKQFAYYL
jgi:hypothetical protein